MVFEDTLEESEDATLSSGEEEQQSTLVFEEETVNSAQEDTSSPLPPPARRKATKPHRFRSGTRSLIEIRQLQKSTRTIIPRAHIYAIVKSILAEPGFMDGLKIKAKAVDALHCEAEALVISIFKRALEYMLHAKRVSMTNRDFLLAKRHIMNELEKYRSLQ